MAVWHLYVKDDDFWHWMGNIYAGCHDDALRIAIANLDPADYDKPIRLDYDDHAPTNWHNNARRSGQFYPLTSIA